MGVKTVELLTTLFWTCEILLRPTWRNLTDSYEGWAYRNGFMRQVHRLEKQKVIESQHYSDGYRLHRLTESGRLLALGGRDPVAQWNRNWDGIWRMVIFDIPVLRSVERDNLRKSLKNRGFGCLQQSVWITPDPVTEDRALLARGPVDVQSLLLLDVRPGAGETDAEIVAGAWDFADINERYAKHCQVLAQCPRQRLETPSMATSFRQWFRLEHEAWLDAVGHDPLLPDCLLPIGYLGREAWNRRLEVMSEAASLMREFNCQE